MRAAAFCALLLAGCASGTPRASETPVASPTGPRVASLDASTLSVESVPRFFPNYTTACTVTTLKDVMKRDFNTSLTRISSALFHHGGDPDAQMEEIANASAAILGCASVIGQQHRPASMTAAEFVTFDHFLNQLVMNTHALQTSALEDERDTVIHWYQHVKQSCAACHARFNGR